MKGLATAQHGHYSENVLMVELIHKQSIMMYRGDVKLPFLKVTMASPKLVPLARRQGVVVVTLPAGLCCSDVGSNLL